MKIPALLLMLSACSALLHADDLTPTAQTSPKNIIFVGTDQFIGPGYERALSPRYSLRGGYGNLVGDDSSVVGISVALRRYFYGDAPEGLYVGTTLGYYGIYQNFPQMFYADRAAGYRFGIQTGYQWIFFHRIALGLGATYFQDRRIWASDPANIALYLNGGLPGQEASQSNTNFNLSLGWSF